MGGPLFLEVKANVEKPKVVTVQDQWFACLLKAIENLTEEVKKLNQGTVNNVENIVNQAQTEAIASQQAEPIGDVTTSETAKPTALILPSCEGNDQEEMIKAAKKLIENAEEASSSPKTTAKRGGSRGKNV